MTFLTLPGCLLLAPQPLVSLISFDVTSRGKIRQAGIHTASAKNSSTILRRYENRSNPLFTWRELSCLAIIGRRKTKKIKSIFRYQSQLDSSTSFCITSRSTGALLRRNGVWVKTKRRRNHIDLLFFSLSFFSSLFMMYSCGSLHKSLTMPKADL